MKLNIIIIDGSLTEGSNWLYTCIAYLSGTGEGLCWSVSAKTVISYLIFGEVAETIFEGAAEKALIGE